jgi:hypothetical protein
MTLDFVLRHPEAGFLSTEDEKMRLFTEKLKLPPAIFPSKVYSGKGPASRTVRYFVDRNPIFVSPAAEGGAPVVSFAYIDASKETTAGFRTYLVQYRSLLRALGKSRLVYVANSAQRFEQAGRDFAKLLGLAAHWRFCRCASGSSFDWAYSKACVPAKSWGYKSRTFGCSRWWCSGGSTGATSTLRRPSGRIEKSV